MPRLADDFAAIRARMEELRQEQERRRIQRERTQAHIREVQVALGRRVSAPTNRALTLKGRFEI